MIGTTMIRRTSAVAAGALAALLVLTACGSASTTTTFTVEQSKPNLSAVLVAEGGKTMGDVLVYVADISRDGKPAGTVSGTLATVDLPGDGIGEEVLESRVASIVFRFSPTDTITVAGSGLYPATEQQMVPKVPQLRAITGGTGTYIGARGQVATTRNVDGTYTHTFELLP